MEDYFKLEILCVYDPPVKLLDVIYICPVCENEIELNEYINDNDLLECEVCENTIKIKIRKI
jgi:DNA-directed RNA polymerase subunit RPC12/RpoP